MFSFQDFAGAHFKIWFRIFETSVHKYHSQYSLSSDIGFCASSIYYENTFHSITKTTGYVGKGTPPLKKMFSFGHCPNEGGGRPLPELKNTIYTFIFDGRKRCTSCPKEGEGGEVIWAMPERKHSFLKEVFPYMGRC